MISFDLNSFENVKTIQKSFVWIELKCFFNEFISKLSFCLLWTLTPGLAQRWSSRYLCQQATAFKMTSHWLLLLVIALLATFLESCSNQVSAYFCIQFLRIYVMLVWTILSMVRFFLFEYNEHSSARKKRQS